MTNDFQLMAGVQFLSGRILAKSLLPEPKTSLKCSITSLVSGNKVSFSKKKITIFFFPLVLGCFLRLTENKKQILDQANFYDFGNW